MLAASDAPAAPTRVTDPKTWGAAGWLADIIRRLIDGVVPATVSERWTPSARPA